MTNIRFVLLFLAIAVTGWSQTPWQTVRSFRGTGVPAANMCNTGADLGITYTNRSSSGSTYVCRLNGAGAYTWYALSTGASGDFQPLNANLTAFAATNNAPTASSLAADPTACALNNWVMDIAANGTLTCTQPASTNLSDSASLVRGAGTTNALPKYTNGPASAIGDSGVSDDGTTVALGGTRSFSMPNTTGAAAGVLFKGADRFFHNYKGGTAEGRNLFFGSLSGNFTSAPNAPGNTYEASDNIGMGYNALLSLTYGYENTALGNSALRSLLGGRSNTAVGSGAGKGTTTGESNVMIGAFSGYTETPASNANVSGSNNTWVGHEAGPGSATQINNTCAVGYRAHPTVSNTCVIGNASVTDVYLGGTGAARGHATPGGTVSACATYTVASTNAAFLAAATAASVTLFALPARGKLTGMNIKHSVIYSDAAGAMTEVGVSVGDGTTHTAYSASQNIGEATAVADTAFTDTVQFKSTTMAASSVVARFTATGRDFGDGAATFLTGGSVAIAACWVVLP